MKQICITTTMWSSINNWIKPFLNDLNDNGIEVTIVCNMDQQYEEDLKQQFPFVKTHAVAFPRGISVVDSIKSTFNLYRFFKANHFDMVQYSTPNASMYAAVAAAMASVPVRLYCQWGMVYVTMHGIKRKVFKCIENLVCHLSTNVQPDSEGNLQFCREQGFYDDKKSCVIWNGSAKGIDLSAYDISRKAAYSEEIKTKYSIPANVPVIGFVGRLGREKGCNELFQAFQIVKKRYSNAVLLFVGPIEKEDTILPELLEYFNTCEDIIKTGRVSNVEKYMSAMDVFVLPSYREGFGMSVVEASAMGIPVIVTEYPGPSSAMVDGVTGYSIPIGSVDSMVDAIVKILEDASIAKFFGENGRCFVKESFDQRIFRQKYLENRMELLGIRSNEEKIE